MKLYKGIANGFVLSLPIWALIIWAVSSCVEAHEGFYLELGVGKNDIFNENDWVGRESVGCAMGAGYVKNFSQFQIDARFVHYSQCTRGNGFDSRSEDDLDSVYLSARYYF